MASRKIRMAAVFIVLGAVAALVAGQSGEAPKPLVRKDLLVFGKVAVAPPVRDIFRPRATGAPAPVRRPAGPAADPAARDARSRSRSVLQPQHQLYRLDQVRRTDDRPHPPRRPDAVGEGGRRDRPRLQGRPPERRGHRRPGTHRRDQNLSETRRPAMKKNALILILSMALAAGACQTLSRDYHQGVTAEMNQNYDEAVKQYQKAALDHPNESVYRMALVRAKLSASLYYQQNGPHPRLPEQEEGGRGELPEGHRLRSPEPEGGPGAPGPSRPSGQAREGRRKARGPGPAEGGRRGPRPELPQRGLPALDLPDPGPRRPASASSTTTPSGTPTWPST